MDIQQLKEKLFHYIASKENPQLSYNWNTTAELLGIDKIQLEYLINEIGDDYFIQNKSGFIATTKAIVEAKYNVKKEDNKSPVNFIGVNYGTANQGSDLRDLATKNKVIAHPKLKDSPTKVKSWYERPFVKYVLLPLLITAAGVILTIVLSKN